MNFRDRMRVSVSNAEMEIFFELQKQKLTNHLETQKPFKFIYLEDGVHGTIIDFYWHILLGYAAFIDYMKLHNKLRQAKKDILIDKALKRRKVAVDRFQYQTIPLSKKRKIEIVGQIKEALER